MLLSNSAREANHVLSRSHVLDTDRSTRSATPLLVFYTVQV
jgi:hypothetical protein